MWLTEELSWTWVSAPKSLWTMTADVILENACSLGGKIWQASHIKKQRNHFADKDPYSQSYGFFSSHVRCETWTIKKAEHPTDAFKLWYWRRLLNVPWTARRSNQSTLRETNPEYSWKDWCWRQSSNTLATWTHWKRPWCWERLKAKGEEGGRGWDG